MANSKDRYPGLRPFEKEDQELFFGRDKEINNLATLIKCDRTMVLFGISGVGKSSLVNVAFQKNEDLKQYWPVRIRIRAVDKSGSKTATKPLEVVESRFAKYFPKKLSIPYNRKDIVYDSAAPQLWEFVKLAELQLAQAQPGRSLVIIFDQFEEYFTYAPEVQEDFNRQLAEIAHEQPPKRILDWITGFEDKDRTDERMRWYQQPDIRIIFSIRSDKLSHFNGMVSAIPQILKNRFELAAFDTDNAIETITKPAGLPNVLLPDGSYKFSSPPINISRSVIEKIISALRNNAGEIEGSFLQIVCYYIEDKVKTAAGDKEHTFDFDDTLFDKGIDIATILDNFYLEQTARRSNEAEVALMRKVIEDDLVYDGQRTSLLRVQLLGKLRGNEDLVEFLLTQRIIKEENSPLGVRYELSHDKLVAPVEKQRELRREKEKAEEEIRIRDEELQREKEEKEKKERELAEKQQQLEMVEKAREEAEAARKTAERLQEIAETSQRLADTEREKAEEAKEIAIDASRKANRAKEKARRRSIMVLIAGIILILSGAGFIFMSLKQTREANVLRAEYLVYKAKDASGNDNNYLAFNLLWAADSILDRYNSGIYNILRKDNSIELAGNRIHADLGAVSWFMLVSSEQILHSEDGSRLVMKTKDSCLVLWRLNNGRLQIDTLFGNVIQYIPSEMFTTIAIQQPEGVTIWDINRHSITGKINDMLSAKTQLTILDKMKFSDDASTILYYDSSNNIKLVRYKNGRFEKNDLKELADIDQRLYNEYAKKIQPGIDTVTLGFFKNMYKWSLARDGSRIYYIMYQPADDRQKIKEKYSLLVFDLQENRQIETISNFSSFPEFAGYSRYIHNEQDDYIGYGIGNILYLLNKTTGDKTPLKGEVGKKFRITPPYVYLYSGGIFADEGDDKSNVFSIINISTRDTLLTAHAIFDPFVYKDRCLYVDTMNNLIYQTPRVKKLVRSAVSKYLSMGIVNNGKYIVYGTEDTLHILNAEKLQEIRKVKLWDKFYVGIVHDKYLQLRSEDGWKGNAKYYLTGLDSLNKDSLRRIMPYLGEKEQRENHLVK